MLFFFYKKLFLTPSFEPTEKNYFLAINTHIIFHKRKKDVINNINMTFYYLNDFYFLCMLKYYLPQR